ncbi:OmpW/AlkL family protein [Aquimarina algicola]|uniref:OmpW family protein n=1 Tax=Aquimarina algicola TaxID=2589995 RepID=A0A504J674_9FLAO|nr:OmpW family protein [Aquimarina algicola]TPN84032.1 OmpW family protein [Aquimarina algicola]
MRRIGIISFICLLVSFSMFSQESDSQETKDFSRWQVRLRGLVVTPDESASIGGIGGDVDISTAFVPELDFTYFFTKNWAAELILATANHDVEAISTAAGDIDLGDVWLLPPTLTLQYHFNEGKFKPYVGAGINYTFFYSADEGPVADDIEYDNNVGFALQAGLDFALNDRWFLNADVKKLFLQTDVTINATSALGATVEADVDINPWLFGIGVGYKF